MALADKLFGHSPVDEDKGSSSHVNGHDPVHGDGHDKNKDCVEDLKGDAQNDSWAEVDEPQPRGRFREGSDGRQPEQRLGAGSDGPRPRRRMRA